MIFRSCAVAFSFSSCLKANPLEDLITVGMSYDFAPIFSLNHPHGCGVVGIAYVGASYDSDQQQHNSLCLGRYRIVGIPQVVMPYGSGIRSLKVAENAIGLTRWWIDAY